MNTAWKKVARRGAALMWLLVLASALCACRHAAVPVGGEIPTAEAVTETAVTDETLSPQWETGYLASHLPQTDYFDEKGQPVGTLLRGTQVIYQRSAEGEVSLLLEGETVYLGEEAAVVSDPSAIIPAHTLYVRSAVNLRDGEGRLLSAFAKKGDAVAVLGYDRLDEEGAVHAYRVKLGEAEGYILPWYLTDTEEKGFTSYGFFTIFIAITNSVDFSILKIRL